MDNAQPEPVSKVIVQLTCPVVLTEPDIRAELGASGAVVGRVRLLVDYLGTTNAVEEGERSEKNNFYVAELANAGDDLAKVIETVNERANMAVIDMPDGFTPRPRKSAQTVDSVEKFTKVLFVGNLPPKCTSEELTTLAEEGGFRARAKVITDRETGYSKRFAFIDVGSDEEAAQLIGRLNGHELIEKIEVTEIVDDKVQVVTREIPFRLVVNEARPRSIPS